ncbi:MAG: carbohydrate kinase [Ignavibacteriae bacterium]|nr:carbohydrate kinase [Ignavibacteriota bacterium]MCB9211638.1 carbohydrate kinase [Ignavibacteriales bacterium]
MNMNLITSIGEILFDIYKNEKQIGGAPFNFIYHINKFIGQGWFISAIGNDEYGKEIQEFQNKNKLSTEFVKIKNEKTTGKVIVKLNDNKIPQYEIKTNAAYDFIELNIESKIKILDNSDLIYFGSLAQRNSVSRETIQSLFPAKKYLFCDLNIRQNFYTKEIIETSLSACNILKINSEEMDLICNLFFSKSLPIKEGVNKIKSRFNIDFVSVTKGEEGAELFSNSKSVSTKAKNVNIVDTVGAGDAYSSILALGILNNLDLEKINNLATSFAAEVCKQQGALIKDDNIYSEYIKELLNG